MKLGRAEVIIIVVTLLCNVVLEITAKQNDLLS